MRKVYREKGRVRFIFISVIEEIGVGRRVMFFFRRISVSSGININYLLFEFLIDRILDLVL